MSKLSELLGTFKDSIANAEVNPLRKPPTKDELIQAAGVKFKDLFDLVSQFNAAVNDRFGDAGRIQVFFQAYGEQDEVGLIEKGILPGTILFWRNGRHPESVHFRIHGSTLGIATMDAWLWQGERPRDYSPATLVNFLEKLTRVLRNYFS